MFTDMMKLSSWMPSQKIPVVVVVSFFLFYLLIGLLIVDDYGLAYDEPSMRYIGVLNLQYMLAGDRTLFEYKDRYYGPIFEILLVGLERLFHLEDVRQIYLMRHVVTFLVFYISVIVFYHLCKLRFRDWRIGLCGSFFLILSPRVFADSFYNSKDITFLAVFIISIYTFICYVEYKTWVRLYWHAFFSAILVDIRILGILVPFLTIFFLSISILVNAFSSQSFKKPLWALGQYSLVVMVGVWLFFPFLWENPIEHFLQAFVAMSQFPWGLEVLYLGQSVKATNLPWHYLPVWIVITTPFLYLVLFSIGGYITGLSLLKYSFYDLLFLSCLATPILAVIVFKSVVYDGWRHLFFIYPAFLLLALNGLVGVLNLISMLFVKKQYKIIAQGFCILMIVAGLVEPLYAMITDHPFQNVYFNRLAGKNFQDIKTKFELDYWGLSYTQAMKYLVTHDPDEQIKVVIERFPRAYCAAMLPAEERARVNCIKEFQHAKYFIGNYRMNKDGYPCDDEVYAVKVRGVNLAVVYKTTNCRTQ